VLDLLLGPIQCPFALEGVLVCVGILRRTLAFASLYSSAACTQAETSLRRLRNYEKFETQTRGGLDRHRARTLVTGYDEGYEPWRFQISETEPDGWPVLMRRLDVTLKYALTACLILGKHSAAAADIAAIWQPGGDDARTVHCPLIQLLSVAAVAAVTMGYGEEGAARTRGLPVNVVMMAIGMKSHASVLITEALAEGYVRVCAARLILRTSYPTSQAYPPRTHSPALFSDSFTLVRLLTPTMLLNQPTWSALLPRTPSLLNLQLVSVSVVQLHWHSLVRASLSR
jgi:hypothetical protein